MSRCKVSTNAFKESKFFLKYTFLKNKNKNNETIKIKITETEKNKNENTQSIFESIQFF